ncbi:MAG: Druantia anti-phage system protein DruA [Bryobacteraceae bacterium]
MSLPALQPFGGRGPRRARLTSRSDPQPEIIGSAGEFEPLRLSLLGVEDQADLRLWTEYLERYHYLGHRMPVGASLRYRVHSERCPEQVLACLLWSSAAWKIAARDRWIGWSPEKRARNLPFVVNNSRFLLLPWIRIQGLASKILGQCARQLPADWERRYGYRPLLLETLVEEDRFRGTCYRAANWIALGRTCGRGRMDRDRQAFLRPKLVFVYPLGRHVPQRLCRAPAPTSARPPAPEDSDGA